MEQMFTVTLSERQWDDVQLAIADRMMRKIKVEHTDLADIQEKIDNVIDRTHV